MDEYLPAHNEAAAPPDSVTTLVGEHTGLAIAAGFGIGLLAGAVIPGGMGGAAARRTAALAATVAEIALTLRGRGAEGGRVGSLLP